MLKENIPTTLSTAYSIQGETLPGIEIISLIEKYFKLGNDEIRMKTRIRDVVFPRQIAIWIIANKNMKKKEEGKPEWSKIIRLYFPQFDHATMIHSYRTVENMIATNKIYRHQVNEILRMIKIKSITIGESQENKTQ